MSDSIIPRCAHGNIILGCPELLCVEQDQYVSEMEATSNAYCKRQQLEARKLVREYIAQNGNMI